MGQNWSKQRGFLFSLSSQTKWDDSVKRTCSHADSRLQNGRLILVCLKIYNMFRLIQLQFPPFKEKYNVLHNHRTIFHVGKLAKSKPEQCQHHLGPAPHKQMARPVSVIYPLIYRYLAHLYQCCCCSYNSVAEHCIPT